MQYEKRGGNVSLEFSRPNTESPMCVDVQYINTLFITCCVCIERQHDGVCVLVISLFPNNAVPRVPKVCKIWPA